MLRTAGFGVAFLAWALTDVPALRGQGGGTPLDPEVACIEQCPTVRGPFGVPQRDQACVARCLLASEATQPPAEAPRDREIPVSAGDTAIRFTPVWDRNPVYRRQKAVIEQQFENWTVRGAPNAELQAAVRRWAVARVSVDRRSTRTSPLIPAMEMHMSLDQLVFDDGFFTADAIRQRNLIMFELGKVFWLHAEAIRPSQRTAAADARRAAAQIESLAIEYGGLFKALKFAPFNGSNLGDLGDADQPSAFGYAFRAVMLNLAPPAGDRQDATRWDLVRPQLERAILDLLR
jgi:hypothetical protein